MFSPKNIYTFLSATLLFISLPISASAAIIQQTFSAFQGKFESANLPLGGGQAPTGVISAIQNPNVPSIVIFDTDTKQSIFDLNFLIDFPLLDILGITEPLPIAPFETGPYTEDGPDLIAEVTGKGLVTGSSPFAGIETFFQVRWRVTSPLDSPIFLGVIESEIVDICTPPAGTPCVQTTGVGEAFLATSVPEPSFLFSFLVLGTIGTISTFKSTNKSSSSPKKV